jgi:heat shock protein HspQ
MEPDTSDEPVRHPELDDLFERDQTGCYRSRNMVMN